MGATANHLGISWRTLEDLVHLIKGGSEAAYGDFALFLMAILPPWFVRRGVPAADGEDLAVDCIIKCRAALDGYHPRNGAGIQSWILAIAWNLAVDFFERLNAESFRLDDLKPAQMPVTEPEILTELFGDVSAADPQTVRVINDALAQLSDLDQQIIHLRYFSQLADFERTFQTIGQILGIPEGTARQRHNRAVKRIEVILIDDPRIKLRRVSP